MINQSNPDPDNPQTISNSLLSSIIVVILAFVYIISRIGLQEIHSNFVYVFSGLSLLLLNSPYWVRYWVSIRRKEGLNSYFFNEPLITFYILFLLTALSYCGIPVISFVLATFGVLSFAATIFQSYKTRNRIDIFALLIICIFGFWIGAVCWSGHYLTPLFVESIELTTLNESSLDPIFHIAIAQIIKNYGEVSNGLHLLTPIKYHILSHFILARISDLCDIHMVRTYNIGFVLIFPPLFVKFMLAATDSLREFFKLPQSNSSFIFTMIILGISSILPIPLHNRLAERIMIGNNFQFISESYLVSLLIALTVLITLAKASDRGKSFKYGLIIFLPISVALCTIAKVSTGFVLTAVLGYLCMRAKGYSIPNKIIGAILICCSFALAGFWVFASDSTNGSFEWMHFFNNYIEARVTVFLLLFFVWPLAFCAAVFSLHHLKKRNNKADLPLSKLVTAAEIVVVTSLVGLVPPLTVEMAGGSGVFFLEIQRWIALVMFASILPLLIQCFNVPVRAMKILKVVMLMIIVVNTVYYSARALKHNLLVRTYYVLPERAKEISEMNLDAESILTAIGTLRDPVLIDSFDVKVKASSIYSALTNLMKLSSQAEEGKILYIVDYSVFAAQLPCYHYFYFIPAFSGFAVFQGLPQWCIGDGYFLETQERSPVYNERSFCEALFEKGFSTLYKYDIQKDTCKTIQCRQIE